MLSPLPTLLAFCDCAYRVGNSLSHLAASHSDVGRRETDETSALFKWCLLRGMRFWPRIDWGRGPITQALPCHHGLCRPEKSNTGCCEMDFALRDHAPSPEPGQLAARTRPKPDRRRFPQSWAGHHVFRGRWQNCLAASVGMHMLLLGI